MDAVGKTGKVFVSFKEKENLVELSFSAPGSSPEEHELMAHEAQEAYNEIISRYPDGKFLLFVDLTSAGVPGKHATDIYVKTLSDKRITKVAFFGMGKAIASIINFIINSSGKTNKVNFFIDREKALNWLKAK